MLLILTALLLNTGEAGVEPTTYERPVIGILAQMSDDGFQKLGHTYIAASYVKYIEMAGAQVYPVMESWSNEKLNKTLHSLNGMLIPGGGQDIPKSQFYRASKFIYDWVVDRNQKGMHFPLWGTCMGFEAILAAQANLTEDIRFKCDSHMANNLTIEEGAQDSRMLQKIDSVLFEAIQSQNVVYNSHDFCTSPDKITKDDGPLHNSFNLLATNWDAYGQKYIALVEHKKLPIYASQFHPEKSGFEWNVYRNVPHTQNAVYFMQYLANFFISEAVQNKNKFADAQEFYRFNINNYNPVYTRRVNYTFDSCYFFKTKGNSVFNIDNYT